METQQLKRRNPSKSDISEKSKRSQITNNPVNLNGSTILMEITKKSASKLQNDIYRLNS